MTRIHGDYITQNDIDRAYKALERGDDWQSDYKKIKHKFEASQDFPEPRAIEQESHAIRLAYSIKGPRQDIQQAIHELNGFEETFLEIKEPETGDTHE